MLDTIDSLYQKYNVLIDENEYSIKYDIPHAHMFVIEGIEKVKDVIEKNRKRKLTKHKKLSNNTIIEIDNCSPLEILKLQKNLLQIAEQEQITFVYGKGKRKPEIQQLYEELEELLRQKKNEELEKLSDALEEAGVSVDEVLAQLKTDVQENIA